MTGGAGTFTLSPVLDAYLSGQMGLMAPPFFVDAWVFTDQAGTLRINGSVDFAFTNKRILLAVAGPAWPVWFEGRRAPGRYIQIEFEKTAAAVQTVFEMQVLIRAG